MEADRSAAGVVVRPDAATRRLRVRAELLAAGGQERRAEFMAELRATHLGGRAPGDPEG